MARRAAGRPLRRITLAVAALVTALAAVIAAAPPAGAERGLNVTGVTTYRVEPGRGVVRVRVEVDLVNTMPSRRTGAYIQTPYFDSFVVPALGPVRNVSARSSAGGKIPVNVRNRRGGLSLVTVDLTPNLVHGAPQSVTVKFDLPGQPARSREVTRVNGAFAGWFALGIGDPGEIDIVIDVPRSFDLSVTRPVRGTAREHGRRRVHRFTDIRKLDNAAMFASAADEQRLARKDVTVGDTTVTVKGWPDDPKWSRFATRTVKQGLPALQEILGRDVVKDRLTVLESSRSYQFGYAGVYVPELGVVEVGDELDDLTVLHELSHVWINDDLFTHRWITEGLAEEAANRALVAIGEKAKPPRRIKPGLRGALPLNDWSHFVPLDGSMAATERFAYNASYAVVHRIADQIGEDGLRDVVNAAADAHISYQGDPAPERMNRARDWRYFYDLVELVGGASDVDELFADHVVARSDADDLRARRRALAAYDELVAAGAGWSPPLDVRQRMGNWAFTGVDVAMDQAHEALSRAREVVDELNAVGIDVGGALEAEYESATIMSKLDAAITGFEDVAREAAQVREREAAAGPVRRLGLLAAGGGLSDGSVTVDDPEDARAAVVDASAALDAAARTGWTILGVVLLLAALVALIVRARRRAARRPSAEPQPVGFPDE